MKALIITAITSFFALSATAQVSTDTKATDVSTGQKPTRVRPAKVVDSAAPATDFKNASGDNAASKTTDTTAPNAERRRPATGKTGENTTKSVSTLTNASEKPLLKEEAPKQ